MLDVLDQSGASAPPIAPMTPLQRRLVVIATALIAASVGLTVGALGPALPSLHVSLHTPLRDLGVLIGVDFFGSLLVTLWLGTWLDRLPPRPFLLGGAVIMAAGLLLVPLAGSLPVAIAAFALAGAGTGTNSVGGTVLTTRLSADQDGRALSWINMSFGLGAFVGPLLAAAALDRLHDYRPVFIGIALLLVAPMLLYCLTPLPAPPRPATHRPVSIERRWWPAIGLLAAIGFLYLGAEVGFGGWVFTYVRTTSHAGTALASWAPAGYWLALSAGSVGAALRPRWVRLERLVLVCGGGCVLAVVSFVAVVGAVPQVILATVLGLCLGPIYPLTVAEAARLVPHAAGKVSGLVLASSQVGGSILPWLQGRLLAEGAIWGAGLTIGACAALTMLQVAFIRHHHAA